MGSRDSTALAKLSVREQRWHLGAGSLYDTVLFLPRPASAEDSEAVVVGLRTGEAVAPTLGRVGGLEVILGVTTAGEPGPRSIRLSSVASFNI